jgi:hypothetical protein
MLVESTLHVVRETDVATAFGVSKHVDAISPGRFQAGLFHGILPNAKRTSAGRSSSSKLVAGLGFEPTDPAAAGL